MPRAPFKHCALHYLNQGLAHDRRYCEALEGTDEATKYTAIEQAAAFYQVARNLWEKHDVKKGLRRYEPLLRVLDSQNPTSFQGDQLIPAIQSVRKQIASQYGNRDVLSLTTKFLWLKLKSPILVYDSRARNALCTREGDIDEYYRCWRQNFDDNAGAITSACDSLQDVLEWSVNPEVGTARYVRDVSAQQWFKERVFDIYLWHLGGN